MAYEKERQVAVETVLRACRLCQAVRDALVSEETMAKEDRSPVTVADFGSQAVISLDLLRAFPDDPVAAEEDATDLRTSAGSALRAKVTQYVNTIVPELSDEEILASIDRGTWGGGPTRRYWVLDPIDGTKGFLRGDQYAVALALIEEGQIVLGVLGCPNLPIEASHPTGPKGSLFIALKGGGAAVRRFDDSSETRIGVTEIADPAQAVYCESFEDSHSSHNRTARIAAILGVTKPPLRIDSQCKYGVVARGDVSIYFRLPPRATYEDKIWDHAAGSIVLKEAGGEVTDVYGRPLDFSLGRTLRDTVGILATNGKLHTRVLKAIRQVLESD